MKRTFIYLILSIFAAFQLLCAQFLIEKTDGSFVNLFDEKLYFSEDSRSGNWAIGDEYSEENDVENIVSVRRAFPSVPFDSDFYYGRSLLETEQEKAAYDYLLNTFLTYTPPAGTTGIVKRIAVDFASAAIEVTYDQLLKIGKYLSADEPRLLMVQSFVPKGDPTALVSPPTTGNVGIVYYDARFYNVSWAYSIQSNNMAKIEAKVSTILAKLKNDMTDAQKFRVLHDEFIKSVSYGGMSTGASATIEGAFIPNNYGYCAIVCQGYARGLQYLCQRAGIQVIYVTGTASYSEPPVDHAWNMVKIEGQWYNTDPTNDDPPTGASIPVRYDDFLQSDNDFLHDHTPGISTQGTAVSYPVFPQTAAESYPLADTEYPIAD